MSTQLVVEPTPSSMFSLSPYSLNDHHHHHHHHHSTSTHSYQYDPISSGEQTQNLYLPGHISPSHQHSSYPTPYTSPPSRMRTAADSTPSSSSTTATNSSSSNSNSKQSSSNGSSNNSNSNSNSSNLGMLNPNLNGEDNGNNVMKRTNKTHVPSACINCKKAHLACDGKCLLLVPLFVIAFASFFFISQNISFFLLIISQSILFFFFYHAPFF